MRIVVEIVDLRLALASVVPHADKHPDIVRTNRVRIGVGTENVTVSSTNNYTAAHALVSLWDTDGNTGAFDLSPKDVNEILALFHGKAGAEGEQGDVVEITIDEKVLVITDISGLFAGKSLTLPRHPMEDNYPDIAGLIRDKLEAPRDKAGRLITSAKLLTLFTKASGVYGQPLVIDPAGDASTMLITCGESFVGLLAPQRPDDDRTAQINRWHLDWRMRLANELPVDDDPDAAE